jgi:hypothetical protein
MIFIAQFRGTYNPKTDDLVAEIGLAPSPDVYLKLSDLNGKPGCPGGLKADFKEGSNIDNGSLTVTSKEEVA